MRGLGSRHPAALSVPQVPGLPLLGNFVEFRRDRLAFHAKAAKLGPIARFGFGPVQAHIVTDADLAHQILVEDAASYVKGKGIGDFLVPLLGQGLLTAEGDLHRRHRKLLAPAFAPKRTNAHANVMVRETLASLARWHALGPSARLDMAEAMMELTLTIAGKTLFGQDLRQDANIVGEALTVAMQTVIRNMLNVVPLPMTWPLPRNRQLQDAIAKLNDVVYRVIGNLRALPPAQLATRGDVLSLILLAHDEQAANGAADAPADASADAPAFSDVQVRDEVMTLLLAGHETTANALSWTLYELGRHPAIERAAREQVDQVLGGRDVTVDDLPNLPLVLACIEEAMRLYPPAYVIVRDTAKATTLGGHAMPAGATIVINVRGTHRHPAYWEQPERFTPERMLPAAKAARSRHVYLPFGAGPRVCIGAHFALLEAQLVLATLLQRTTIRMHVQHRDPEPLITLRPRGGLPASVTPR